MLVFIFKQRYHALGGMIVAGLGILLAWLAVGGIGGLVGYMHTILGGAFLNYRGGMSIDPSGMINWRAVLINLFPGLPPARGSVLTTVLSVTTLAALPLVWRGPWNPRAHRFALQISATLGITLLVAYHSHVHGAALLLVPSAAALSQPQVSTLVRRLVMAGWIVPPCLALINQAVLIQYELSAMFLTALIATTVIVIVVTQARWVSASGVPDDAVSETGRHLIRSRQERTMNSGDAAY